MTHNFKNIIKTALLVLRRDGFIIFFKRTRKYFLNKAKKNRATDVLTSYEKNETIGGRKDLISVVIPVYDRVQKLKESIDSILNQTYKNFEIIIVTDGSPKETIDLLGKYEKNSIIKIFYYYNNTGNAVRGRNKGIKEAKGEYIAFQDSDDIAEPDRLENSLLYAKKFKADIVYGGWRAIVDGTREIKGIKNEQEMFSPDCVLGDLREKCVPCQSTVMVRRKALVDVGGLKKKMRYREDHELWLRLAHFGYKLKSISIILTNLRLHKGNNELNFVGEDEKWKKLTLEEYKKKTKLPRKITYIIPGVGISGGVAVVLQHANRLLSRGYDIFIISQDFRTRVEWFPKNKVEIVSMDDKREYLFEETDILIGTAWDTIGLMKKGKAERKIYFVQSDERRFDGNKKMKEKIEETYRTKCEYMTEAKWIQKWLRKEFDQTAYYVPNGLDEKIFHPTKPIEKKVAKCRVLLEGAIDIPYKGMEDAYSAVKDLDCEVWIVSNRGRPLRNWKYNRFFENVDMLEMKMIYSACDIFLKMSRVEGFFGPPLEAMACGCAVVVGKVTGYDEFIENGYNALVVDQRDINGAREAVKQLIDDEELRKKLIDKGYKTAEEWNWEHSIEKLEEVINEKGLK